MPLEISPSKRAQPAAIMRMVTGFAHSDGWAVSGPILIHEVAPLTSMPRPGIIGSMMSRQSMTKSGTKQLPNWR